MDLDFLANFAQNTSNEELSYSKEDILKLLKRIGVDTRFVSYFEDKKSKEFMLYVENFRFSKFSKKRIAIFNNYYDDIKVIRSSLFQKICLRASKVLANSLKPKTNILIPDKGINMSKKTMKIISVIAVMLCVMMSVMPVFAADIDPAKINGQDQNVNVTQVGNFGNRIATILRNVGIVISVLVLMVIGIKYMLGSAEEKAEYKKTMIPYLVGAVVLLGASTIAGAVIQFAK